MNNVKLPTTIKTFSKTSIDHNEKPQIFEDLTAFVTNHVRTKALTKKDHEKQEFINQCKIACKLAVKVIQEAKNHSGKINFTDIDYYGELNDSEAIELFNKLTAQSTTEEATTSSNPSDMLDKLCRHMNTVITNRKLSFWGTNYTKNAEKFRKWVNELEKNINTSGTMVVKEIDVKGKKLENFNMENHIFDETFNAEGTTFSGSTNFSGCHFREVLDLSSTKFLIEKNSIIDFSRTKFEKIIRFYDGSKSTTVKFDCDLFGLPYTVNFNGAEFKEDLVIHNFGNGRGNPTIDLRNVKIAEEKFIMFNGYLRGHIIKLDKSLLKHIMPIDEGYYSKTGPGDVYSETQVYIDDKLVTREELEKMRKETFSI